MLTNFSPRATVLDDQRRPVETPQGIARTLRRPRRSGRLSEGMPYGTGFNFLKNLRSCLRMRDHGVFAGRTVETFRPTVDFEGCANALERLYGPRVAD